MTNLVEILKNAPKGLELYSPIYGKVTLSDVQPRSVYVKCESISSKEIMFDEYGRKTEKGECLLFPSKECKNWNGWQLTLFKPGHFITTAMGLTFYIKTKLNCDFEFVYKDGSTGDINSITTFRFASTEEIEHFYVELRKNGYTIKNGELKPAEKCGIRLNISTSVTETKLTSVTETKEQKLINSKPFTIDDFKPFDKVLGFTEDGWEIDLFSDYCTNKNETFPYHCLRDYYRKCIPYNDETKHLLGTTEEYNGKYKTW